MERRAFLHSLPIIAGALALPWELHGQDVEFLRALERAQAMRPKVLMSVSRIAPLGEPGTPLIIRGRVFRSDGKTLAPEIIVFAYHTDRNGLYAPRTEPPHTWRLKGWARTDAEGRFEFHTIRPGAYPGRKTSEHVHFSIEGPSLSAPIHAGIEFEDDPLVTADARHASAKQGIFGSVRPVQKTAEGQLVEFNIRIVDSGRF